ncbi:chromosomal replication initiator protein DnaA [Patescibacteria group bacterium]|nr:chromosomal replication initiator protein DnaA [Patescibacteria group bacterium]
MNNDQLHDLWKATLGELEVELGKNNFGIYLKNSTLLSLENGVAKLGFKNKGVAQSTSSRYYSLIQNSLQKISTVSPLSLVFDVDTSLQSQTTPEAKTEPGPLFAQPKEDKQELLDAIKRCHLRPDFTFEEFCVSTSNQLAFAAATATAQNPGKNYNPLFIWGGVGVGKTHLMQAVGHEILRKNPRAKIIFAPGEQFTNEIIAGIRSKNTAEFKERYRSADALLIDDIQFLSGKDTAQEEFFHTFNAISQNGGQIVMTSDRKPADIADLADRLRSRFEGGMVADISTPDSELKTAICMQKARKRGIELSNSVAFSIASNVDNIRSLEGALQKILMAAQANKLELTPELVLKVLEIKETPAQAVTRLDARLIVDRVCAFYELPIKLIKGEKRDKPIAVPRQILMYLLRHKGGMTYEEIADYLGGRDHTTIIHGVNKVSALLETNERIRGEVEQLQQLLVN